MRFAWYMAAMLKLFGSPVSTCTRKVLATLNETKTPFDFVAIDFAKGEHKAPAHMARQPFGQVPALEDDGFKMYEARAMARYIDAKAGGSLTPKDLQGRARMEQWISVETENFSSHAMKFIYHSVFKREQPAEVLTKAGAGLDVAFGAMDRQLAETPYLAGETLSIADYCYAPYLEYLPPTPAATKIDAYPHVKKWWAAVRDRPAWRKTIGG
jgi:glutathione S-transferase